jgi:hypothetical protein
LRRKLGGTERLPVFFCLGIAGLVGCGGLSASERHATSTAVAQSTAVMLAQTAGVRSRNTEVAVAAAATATAAPQVTATAAAIAVATETAAPRQTALALARARTQATQRARQAAAARAKAARDRARQIAAAKARSNAQARQAAAARAKAAAAEAGRLAAEAAIRIGSSQAQVDALWTHTSANLGSASEQPNHCYGAGPNGAGNTCAYTVRGMRVEVIFDDPQSNVKGAMSFGISGYTDVNNLKYWNFLLARLPEGAQLVSCGTPHDLASQIAGQRYGPEYQCNYTWNGQAIEIFRFLRFTNHDNQASILAP